MLKNGFARKLSSIAASATLFVSFGGASARSASSPQAQNISPAAGAAPPPPGHRLWRNAEYNAVVDVWECPSRGLCARIQRLDPDNRAMRKLVAERLLHKPVAQVTADDVNKLCGRESTIVFTQIAPEVFDGNLNVTQPRLTIGMHVEFRENEQLRARVFLPVFGRSFTPLGMNVALERERAPVAPCLPPRP